MQPIASLKPGMRVAVLGDVKSAHLATTRRRGFRIFHAVVGDSSGAIRCSWMNQAFLQDVITPHLTVVIFGDVKLDSSGLHFLNPEYELAADGFEEEGFGFGVGDAGAGDDKWGEAVFRFDAEPGFGAGFDFGDLVGKLVDHAGEEDVGLGDFGGEVDDA